MITLYRGDAVAVLKSLPPQSVDLVFADPPFNIGYEYDGYADELSDDDYRAFSMAWLRASAAVLKPTGSLVVAIGEEYAAELKVWTEAATPLRRRQTIQWVYNFGVYCSGRFGRNHTTLYHFTRGRHRFNADAVRVPSLRQTKYGDARADARGRVPGNVWEVPRVCGTHKERLKSHPCQMPEAVLDRVVLAFTDAGDTVVDPFAGSGTTLAVASRLGRRCVGVESSAAYCDAIRQRLGRDAVEFVDAAADAEGGEGAAVAATHDTGGDPWPRITTSSTPSPPSGCESSSATV